MAHHRIYQYTSIGRPLEPEYPGNKAVLILMPLAALLGAVTAWLAGGQFLQVLQSAVSFLLICFGSWALARELFPDDRPAAFVSMVLALLAALAFDSPGILIVFATLGLVRIVNRSTGRPALKSDSLVVMLLTFWVIYATQSPFYGAVAALAFIFDGSLKDPLRRQWIFALICFGGMVVYMVDHDAGLGYFQVPDSLLEWLSMAVLLVLALNMFLLKEVSSSGVIKHKTLDLSRVKGGMAVGLFAAFQGLVDAEAVIILMASLAGIGIGMAFRKAFQAPASV
ncbi:MAG: hypothetical protein V3S21_05400 [Xanthomonadales bacterium]